jgi:hypothetical protein
MAGIGMMMTITIETLTPKKGVLVNITLNVVAAAPFGCRLGGTIISCTIMILQSAIQAMIT